jgi:hypothetical protein
MTSLGTLEIEGLGVSFRRPALGEVPSIHPFLVAFSTPKQPLHKFLLPFTIRFL